MADFISISEARKRKGLRLALLQGVPSPWGQAAKAIFELKKIPYTKVHRLPDDPPGALMEWTHQDSFPAAMLDDERPRTGWAEILFLAERLGRAPALIPADPADRALMFGISHEICGEMGLGWAYRLLMLAPGLANTTDPMMRGMAHKYGSSSDEVKVASQRTTEVLRLLARQLASGGGFLVGGQLSAADIYWATFSNLLQPLPQDQMPLPDAIRTMFTARDPEVLAALDPSLIEHRDRIYRQYIKLPVEL
jgi:glutathione S-transferase